MEEKKKTPFPGTFSKNSKNLQYSYRFCFELSLLVTWYKKITNFTCISILATTHKLAKWKIKVYMRISMWKEMDILAIVWKREQKVQNNDSNKNNW